MIYLTALAAGSGVASGAPPIQLRGGDVPADRVAIAGRMAPCQALDLDPDDPAQGSGGAEISVTHPSLREPLSADLLRFTCAQGVSEALIVSRKGERHLVLSHLRDLEVSPDGRSVYVAGAGRSDDGRWDDLIRVIDLSSKKAHELPHAACTNGGAVWSGEALVTWGRAPASGAATEMCVWSRSGALTSRVGVMGCWEGAEAPQMVSTVGVLPSENNVFYLYKGACVPTGERCMVHMQELDGMGRARSVPVEGLKAGAVCPGGPDLELQMDKVNLSSGAVAPRRLPQSP